jgi:hypothetical protein
VLLAGQFTRNVAARLPLLRRVHALLRPNNKARHRFTRKLVVLSYELKEPPPEALPAACLAAVERFEE